MSVICWSAGRFILKSILFPLFGALLVQDLDVEGIEKVAAKWNERVAAVTRQQGGKHTPGAMTERSVDAGAGGEGERKAQQ